MILVAVFVSWYTAREKMEREREREGSTETKT